jgi:hypothetical protein
MNKAYLSKTHMIVRALEKKLIYFGHAKREKRYWALNTYT